MTVLNHIQFANQHAHVEFAQKHKVGLVAKTRHGQYRLNPKGSDWLLTYPDSGSMIAHSRLHAQSLAEQDYKERAGSDRVGY